MFHGFFASLFSPVYVCVFRVNKGTAKSVFPEQRAKDSSCVPIGSVAIGAVLLLCSVGRNSSEETGAGSGKNTSRIYTHM